MTRRIPDLKRIVIKIGSSSLISANGSINERMIIEVSRQISLLNQKGIKVVLVSSGAVAAGRSVLPESGSSLDNIQAAAAIGQPILMRYFQEFFQIFNMNAGQLLLTHEDLRSRRRYLNARNTINYLLEKDMVPVINENDSVSTEEIRFSDNDFLAALCTNLINADLFIILSNIDGVADKNPLLHPDARIYETLGVGEIESLISTLKGETVLGMGRGGIMTKLRSPLMAARYGVPSIIANSSEENILLRLVEGDPLGTYVEPDESQLNAWRAYIAHAMQPRAVITIDAGAAQALSRSKASLLASGIISTSGTFQRGDGVLCCLEDGTEVVKGIVEYSQDEVEQIAGKNSSEIENILGYAHRKSVIHRDNMVTVQGARA
ncbi:MAG: glutamate 5-kinase [Candidatus Marinimicrobia bacterium]|nr:glutamate 5-kinase [Candidatus Neomarinimicrobiota bacterium]